MAVTFAPKDPDETLDYELTWTGRLGTDTIASSEWIVPSGINNDDDDNSDTATTIRLSGGTKGESYSLVNRITTAGGQIMDQTCKIKVKTK